MEDPSTSNMVNGPKHCWKLKDSTFTTFIDPCQNNSGWKCVSEWHAISYDCLLNHSLPTISILFLTEAIYGYIFRDNYLRNEKLFDYFFFFFFFLHFINLDSILNIFKKTMTLIADVFLNLRTPKNVLRKISKKSCFRGSFNT